MKRLIVYFSRSGHNKRLAEELLELLPGDKEEIVDLKPKGFLMSGFQAIRKKSTTIAEIKCDPADYDQVILLSPMWVGGIPPAVRAYAEDNFKRIKQLALASVSGNGITNEIYVTAFAKEYGLKITPVLMIADPDFKKKNYIEELEKFAKKCKGEKP